jgi:hypothetical protein
MVTQKRSGVAAGDRVSLLDVICAEEHGAGLLLVGERKCRHATEGIVGYIVRTHDYLRRSFRGLEPHPVIDLDRVRSDILVDRGGY